MAGKGRKVTSRRIAKLASDQLKNSKIKKAREVAGSALSQREASKSLRNKKSGVRVAGRPPVRHKKK